MVIENIVDQILDLPNAEVIAREVIAEIEREKKKRLDFYEWVTPSMKVEFINGEIVIHSPVTKLHEVVSSRLFCLIRDFTEDKELGYTAHEKLMVSLSRNDYEPDIVFFKEERAKTFEEGKSRFPAPDFVVEVLSKSTQKRDRGVKFDDYAMHKVSEYWIIDPKKQTIEQFELKEEVFLLKHTFKLEEKIESFVVQNFTIPVKALFDKEIYKLSRRQLGI